MGLFGKKSNDNPNDDPSDPNYHADQTFGKAPIGKSLDEMTSEERREAAKKGQEFDQQYNSHRRNNP